MDASPCAASAPRRLRLSDLLAALVLAATLAPIVVASRLDPSPTGMGTHEALGLQPCGFVSAVGIPCATCGMTTAFAHAARGQILASLLVQPAGAALALASAMAAILAAYSLVSGVSLAPIAAWLWRPRVVVAALGFGLLAWIYKIILVCGTHPT